MTITLKGTVIRIVESLLLLQNIKLQNRTLTAKEEKECRPLRANVPAGILEKFDRLVSRGKKAVSTVRNAVCSECHLRLPTGKLASLANTTEIHYCDNCTRFLYLPEDEPLGLTRETALSAVKPAAKRSRRKASVQVV